MELRGKVVFITGAAHGLGKAYAEAVLEQGAKVFFVDLDATAGSATSREFSQRFGGQSVRFAVCDVTKLEQFEGVFKQAVSEFGHVDVLVNNAGIMNESKWELMININYIALVYGTKLATEHMRRDKGGRGGRIINISSLAGLNDYFFIPIYCGTKHAVRSFTSSLANLPNIEELGVEYGILCPDAAATDLVLKLDDDKIDYYPQVKSRIEKDMMSVPTVVDGFMELVQLPKMNGAILLVKLEGNTYRKMENHAI